MRWLLLLGLLTISTLFIISHANATTQNLTEHSWIYNQGYMDDMRIYQTDYGFKGQKLVTGTRGSGTVSRTIDARVYGGFEAGYDQLSVREWGVFQYKPYSPSLTQSDLKNALCAKNYEVGSVMSESYSEIRDLVKDTTTIQDDSVSVYEIHSEITGTAKIGSRVQRKSTSVPAYVMGGTYMGYTNMYIDLETGDASILTLTCP
ncbi:MAG: hypothetical protein HPY61_00990 [Methanotrichaceae archaeon]|nr:hypothetical protein [Methanotrichaceae archaeon]